MAYPAVRLQRTLPAPRERVYRAWLDPEILRRWMAPAGLEAVRVEVDERVGGRHRVWQNQSDGTPAGGFESKLLELHPPERIVFAWRFVGPNRLDDDTQETLLTVTLTEPAPGTTELLLVHERLDAFAAVRPDIAQKVEPGWGSALDRLSSAMADLSVSSLEVR